MLKETFSLSNIRHGYHTTAAALLAMVLSGTFSGEIAAADLAHINDPGVTGCIERGRAMLADRNYDGCIDQMNAALRLGACGDDLQSARWCLALAAIALDEEGAQGAMECWLADYPDSPLRNEGLMRLADLRFAAGEWREAAEAYDRVDASALRPALQEELKFRKAYCLLKSGDLDEAQSLLESLKGKSELTNTALFYRAYISYAKGEYRQALRLFRSVDATEAPANATPYYIAQIHYAEGDNRAALEEARKAIAAGLESPMANESKRIAGESLYALGDTDEATKYLWDYAANTDNPSPSAFYILGVSEWDRGDYDAAARLLQQATTADDAMGQSAWLYLGQAQLRQGNADGALMAFERAYKMDYDSATTETAFYNYAVAKSSGGKAPFESSAALFEDFIERFPASRYRADVERHIINGYLADGNYDGALRNIANVEDPSSEILAAKKRALFAKGATTLTEGDAAGALPLLTESRGISAGDPALTRQAMLWQGDCLMQLGRESEAAQAYERFLALAPDGDPNRGLADYDLGYALYRQKKYTKAQSAFNAAIDSGTLDNRLTADAHNRLGDCLSYEKKYREAASQYARAARLTPESADYSLFQGAMMKGYTGDQRGKAAALDHMTSTYPSSPYTPEALLEKGVALSAAGDSAGAISTYTAVVNRYPATAQGRRAALLLAIDARSAGRNADAITAYKNVIADYPSSEEARVAADDLKSIMAGMDNLDEYVSFMHSVEGAPAVEMSDIDVAAFRNAEKRYLEEGKTASLESYITKYPGGTYEAEALYYLAQDADKRGDSAGALTWAQREVSAHPTATVTEDALVILGRSLMSEGREEEATKAYRQLEETASTPANLLAARLGLITNALRAGDNATVIATADKALAGADMPTEALVQIRYMRGTALHRSGKIADAETDWSEAATHVADLYGCKSAVSLAESRLQRGAAKESEKGINKFIDSKPANQYWLARAFITLSDALRAQGKTFEADQYLTTLRSNYPGTEADIPMMIEQRLKKD